MKIRRFEPADAGTVSDLIVKTLRVSNTKDYPPEQMEELILHQQPADVMQRASWTHFYVAEEEGRIIGLGDKAGNTDNCGRFCDYLELCTALRSMKRDAAMKEVTENECS